MRYLVPNRLDEALGFLAAEPVRLLAGGTDFYPALGDRPIFTAAQTDPVMDITGLTALRGLSREERDGGAVWRIGALTSWSDIVRAKLPAAFDGLKAAAREVGSLQIQNAATVVGNLCNASPAADGVPPLLTLEASLELSSQSGTRVVPLAEFITGVRQTVRRPDELVTALLLPCLPAQARSSFVKLGARRYLVISIAMVSVLLVPDGQGKVSQARIAVGSCSAVAQRLSALETALTGLDWSAAALTPRVTSDLLSPLRPIDDIRGSAAYRLAAAEELICRALSSCLGK